MKKIFVSLLALTAVATIFLFSCHKEKPPAELNKTNNSVVVADNNTLKDNFKNDSVAKNDVSDNMEDSIEPSNELEISDNQLSDSEATKNSSEDKDSSKNESLNKQSSSSSNKTESVKPSTEKPSANNSKPESTTQKPNSSTTKPSETIQDSIVSKPSDSKPNSTTKPESSITGSDETSQNNSDLPTDKQPDNSDISDKTETKPAHTHKWTEVYKTVSHKEEREDVWVIDSPAYTEEIPVYTQVPKTICNSCKSELTKETVDSHTEAHMLAGDMKAGWHTEVFREQVGTEVVEHKEKGHWESVVVKEAYTEQILTGYKCECGDIKS